MLALRRCNGKVLLLFQQYFPVKSIFDHSRLLISSKFMHFDCCRLVNNFNSLLFFLFVLEFVNGFKTICWSYRCFTWATFEQSLSLLWSYLAIKNDLPVFLAVILRREVVDVTNILQKKMHLEKLKLSATIAPREIGKLGRYPTEASNKSELISFHHNYHVGWNFNYFFEKNETVLKFLMKFYFQI